MNRLFSLRHMRHHHLALLAAVLTLTGAGCLSSGSSSNTGGVWQSPDGGKSWEATNALPSASGVGSIAAADVTNIEIDPSDASAVYIGTETNGMLWSIDGGASWMLTRLIGKARATEMMMLGEKIRPLESVGIYVPSGTVPLPSTVYMTVVPAAMAGVKEIIIATPPNRETGDVDPHILAVANLLGVNLLNVHTPTDDLVKKFLRSFLDKKNPRRGGGVRCRAVSSGLLWRAAESAQKIVWEC